MHFHLNSELTDAYSECTKLAQSHYENFPVGMLVPKQLQKHVHAVYAFARVSDDIADEGYSDPRIKNHRPDAPSPEIRTQMMEHYQDQLTNCLENKPVDPKYKWIFLPLKDSLDKCQLPPQLFYDLLSAFKQDIIKRRYTNFEEVLDYCKRSANPIGRLVLHLHDIREEKLHALSDHICSALQLANFWQDVSVDLGKDRIYLPLQDLIKHQVNEKQLFDDICNEAFTNCLKEQVDQAQNLFDQGKPLITALQKHSFKLAWEIRMTWLGGTSILKKIRQQHYNTLSKRPKLSKLDFLSLLIKSFVPTK